MFLELIVTPGADDANAYADLDAAQALAAYRGAPGAAFLALDEDQQVQAIATVAADIDAIGDDFLGERASDAQAMEWPRTGTAFDADGLPRNLVRANIEGAIALASAFADGATDDVLNPDANTGNVKRKKTGPLETEYFSPTITSAAPLSRFPRVVQNLLRSLIVSSAAAWGSGTSDRVS